MGVSQVSNRGQVTIPKEMRQKLGISEGSKVEFLLIDNRLEMRVQSDRGSIQRAAPKSGYGMVKSKRPSVPVDLDPASLLNSLLKP